MEPDTGEGREASSNPANASQSAPRWVQRCLDLWHQLEVWIAIIAFSLIALLLIYDVLVREAITPLLLMLGYPDIRLLLYGSQKIALFLLVIGAFTGIGIATWTGAQLVPKMAFRIVPETWNISMNRLADIITFLFLTAVAIIAALFVQESFDAGQMASGGVRIEIWKVQIAIPLGFASAALRYLAFAIWPDTRPAEGETLE